MTIADAAAALGLSTAGVRRRIERGEMQATLISPRLYLISAEEVERWRAMGKLKPGPKPGAKRSERNQQGD
jgi:excisionase family DNA binding protein